MSENYLHLLGKTPTQHELINSKSNLTNLSKYNLLFELLHKQKIHTHTRTKLCFEVLQVNYICTSVKNITSRKHCESKDNQWPHTVGIPQN